MTKTAIIVVAACVALALIIFIAIMFAKRSSNKKVPKKTVHCKNCIWYLRTGEEDGYCIHGNNSETLADCPEKSPKDTCENATFGAKPS